MNRTNVGVEQSAVTSPVCPMACDGAYLLVYQHKLVCLMNELVPGHEERTGVDPICPCGTAQGFEVATLSWAVGERAG